MFCAGMKLKKKTNTEHNMIIKTTQQIKRKVFLPLSVRALNHNASKTMLLIE